MYSNPAFYCSVALPGYFMPAKQRFNCGFVVNDMINVIKKPLKRGFFITLEFEWGTTGQKAFQCYLFYMRSEYLLLSPDR